MADVAWLWRMQFGYLGLLLVRHDCYPPCLLGVAGFAAAADYSYFVVDGFTSCADNFVSAIVNFVAATDCSPP
jgi:hypothetical protein